MPNPTINRRMGASAFAYDPEVLDWIARVVANGGSVSQSTKDAANTFMASIKSAGLRSLIARLNFYGGTGLAACAVPFIKDIGGTLDVLTNFVSGDYSESTGLTGDGITKFNDTGVTGTNLAALSGQSFGLYVRTASDASSLTMGFFAGSVFVYAYLSVSNVGNTYFSMGDNTAQIGPVVDSSGSGFYLGSRNGAGGKLYKNGIEIGTSANMGVAPGNHAITVYIHAANNLNAAAFAWSNKALGGYHIGSTFDATQQSNYRNYWQTLQTAFARQV